MSALSLNTQPNSVQAQESSVGEPKATLRSDELLPSLSRWAHLTGLLLMGSVSLTLVVAAIAKYNVAVKATATVRPAGELRVVQAQLEGDIEQIVGQENQPVQQGDAIAYLDDTKLQIQNTQLQGIVQQSQLQLSQLEAQLRSLTLQVLAEEQAMDRSIAAAQSDVLRLQREHLEKAQTAQADVEEAQVAQAQAQAERDRHRPLVEAGAIAQAQFQEREMAVETAQIRLERAQAALNPSPAAVAVAQQQVAQQSARGKSTLASLQKERQALLQRQAEIQAQLLRDQQELHKIEADLENTVIRATSDGVIFKLNLANPNQVVRAGDSIAQIAPQGAALIVRAMVANQDIDKVAVGQTVKMRVEACPYPDFGVLPGVVTAIAADTSSATSRGAETSPQGASQGRGGERGDRTFEVIIQPETLVLQTDGSKCAIQAGMTGNASIISRQETFLQFVLRKARLWSSL
ncbi:MAG: HlyD family efflux transporter periplasmic adaptor subunit [Leptolyngbyaceae cyanobacterium SM2_5_2]|nr:HlyD family efflux transporter periplasmic adaptor subunit [Leptolyngbyaceae cyanobacterium SM2_5_2]